MMRFGLHIEDDNTYLIDMETGEVLTETLGGIQEWLEGYEDNHTLTLID